MKHCQHVVLGAWLLCLVPFTAFAGVGYLAIHGDAQGLSCDIANPPNPGALVTVYVFHQFGVPGESAAESRFRIAQPPEWTFITFTNTPGYVPIGSALTDVRVGYGECVNTPIIIGTVLCFANQAAPPCSQFQILAPVGLPSVVGYDCSFVEYSTVGLGAVVNPQASCCCQCLATESSTWGSVKALYR